MEHSMSGGVIKDYAPKTLVKVDLDGVDLWYFCEIPVFEGDIAVVEYNGEEKRAVVKEVLYNVTANASPIPFNRLSTVLSIEFE